MQAALPTPVDLIYVSDQMPGIRRERRGRGWSFIAPDGTRIDNREERARINALAVPPAYEDVWICPRANGHLQATGRDARKRKQYRYHPDWTAFRARQKFDDLAAFGAALPRIRRAIRNDLNADPGTQEFAVAAVLTLLDRMSIRVGSPDYTRENKTYGATTLRDRHLTLTERGIRLCFTAKGGDRVQKTLRDARLNKIFHQLDDLPGATLISWVEGETPRAVTSDQVNGRLDELTGGSGVTAKTFRTWNGSVAAVEAALKDEPLTIKAMAEAAADRLHNTPSIARNSYIHPAVIDLAELSHQDRTRLCDPGNEVADLRQAERGLLSLLRP